MAIAAVGGIESTRRPRGEGAEAEYQPFPDVSRRNAWQEHVEVPTLVRALGLSQGGRVLEVGCGRGVALPVLAERLRPARLVGLDVDGALLGEAAARLRHRRCEAELVQADVRDMPFSDASFDLVLDFGTCYHVARSDHALREISRVLVVDGRFVHETRASQLLSHPVRARGRRLPWLAAPGLRSGRHALLWAVRTKLGAVVARGLLALALAASAPVVRAGDPLPPSPAAPPAPLAAPSRVEAPGTGPTRLFFAPTARSLPRGRGSVGVTEIAFPWVEAGIVDRVSVLGFVVPPLGDLSSGGIVVAPKLQLVRHARVQAAAGVIQAIGAAGTGGIGYGVFTFGRGDAAATVGYGYGYGDLADSEGSPGVLFLGAEKALGRSFRLVVEGWVGGQALGLPEQTLIAAVRFARGRWSVDFGAVVPFYETGSGTPVPLLTVAWGF